MCGLVAAFTGELDWSLWGRPIAGERLFFSAGLLLSAFGLWALGRRSGAERLACRLTLLGAIVSLLAAPVDYRHLSPGWWLYQVPVWLAHVGLAAQLAAWWREAGPERTGVGIMALGMAVEALVVFPLAQLHGVPAACSAGMVVSCIAGPWVAVALPAMVTLALAWLWLDGILGRLGGR